MPSPGEWVPAPHGRALGQAKGDGEKIPDYAAADWTRKSNPNRAAVSNRKPSPTRAWTLNARTFATTTTTTTTASTLESVVAVMETNTGQHRQQVPLGWQYRAVPPPKYYRESDPQKFLMSYEAAIASSGGDDMTLTKSFIISLENVAASWYARLPPRSIASWAQLKEKFVVNFQGFEADLSTEEDFFSCQQYERETLPGFFCRFLHLKAQVPEVSDEQAIKALRAG
jgi:hypothetical protein